VLLHTLALPFKPGFRARRSVQALLLKHIPSLRRTLIMKNRTRLLALSMVIPVLVCLLLWQSLGARVAAVQDDGCKEAYDNSEIFDCLSGAARCTLENKYGKKGDDAVDGSVTSNSGAGSAVITTSLSAFTEVSFQALALNALGNLLVNNPNVDATAQDTQSETALVLGSGMNVVSGFNDSGSFIGAGANKFTGFSRSTNMGATWIDGGTLPTNVNGDAGDPVLARDKVSGRIYFSCLQFSGAGVRVFHSDDDAVTWSAPVQGAPGKTGFQDKEWIAVDNAAGSGQGNAYLVERDFGPGNGIYLFRSIDQGATFAPSGGLLIASGAAGNVQGAFVTVGPDHAVYVFWYDQGFAPRRIRMRKSTDLGLTFAAPVTVTTLNATVTNGGLSLNGGFRTNSFPQAVVNPASANNIYAVYNDASAAIGGDRGNVFLRQSTDGGATWGAAIQINTDGTGRDQWSPAIGVKPDGSGIGVAWYDRRRDPANSLIESWGAIATVSGNTVAFGPNFRISGQFPVVIGQDPVVNPVYMGDYDAMVADNSFFYTTWGDNSLPNPNFPAHAHQPDVRFAKIPMAGPGPILDVASTTISGGDGDGIIQPDECNNLTVKVMNDGTATATGIIGVLSTSTPGVTVTQPISDFPDLAPGAMGASVTPFRIDTSPSFVCGTPIVLTLTLTYAQGSDIDTITLQSCACPPTNITSTLGSPTPGAGYTVSTGLEMPRLFRNGVASTCAGRPCPGTFGAGNYHFDSYTFTNGGSCTTVKLTQNTGTALALFTEAYLGSFNPGSLCTNYLGDAGVSQVLGADASYSFNIPANASFVIVVNEVNPGGGAGANYTLNVSGLICGTSGNGECTLGCTLGHGYWKNHASAWPVSSLTLGTVTYTKAQLLSILSQPVKGNGLVSLAHQLIAARLNLASGAQPTPAVLQAITDANSLIGGLVIPPIGSGFLLPSSTDALNTALDNYNEGLAPGGPPSCP
jgi:hypothetical protein